MKNLASGASSSGGAFPTIASAYNELSGNNLVVYGAAFTADFEVKHVRVAYNDGLSKLYESKYVQSDISNALHSIVEDLKRKIPVLFIGTSCQVFSIKKQLESEGIDTDILLTVDLICHGTPQKRLWSDYVELIKRNNNSAIKNLSFRYKNGDCKNKGRTYVEFTDNRKYYDPPEMRSYMFLFSTSLSLNSGCFNCLYKNKSKPSDITIGDFWGVNEVLKGFKKLGDVSLISTNSEKGERVLQYIASLAKKDSSFIIKECTTDRYLVFNPHLYTQTPKPTGYKQFWNDYKLLSVEELYEKYSISKKAKAKRIVTAIASALGIKWKLKYIQYQLKK